MKTVKNFLIIFIFLSFMSCQSQSKITINENSNKEDGANNKTLNDSLLIIDGVSFKTPKSWQHLNQNESVNLKGEITAREITYIDLFDESKINIIHFLGDSGKKIFNYRSNKDNQSVEEYIQNGLTFIKKTEVIEFNGKGFKIENPINRLTVDVLSNNGSIQIIFDCKNEKSLNKVNDFLLKIKKTNLKN